MTLCYNKIKHDNKIGLVEKPLLFGRACKGVFYGESTTMGKLKDLTGQRFGKLTVIKYMGANKHRTSLWLCKCDCGKEKVVNGELLKNGETKSCGCLKHQIRQNYEDLTGKKFNRLTVIRLYEIDKWYHKKWLCKCECGNTVLVKTQELKNNKTMSCGCLHKELLSKRSSTHKKSNTRLYKIWSNIKTRCYNPNCEKYKYYGERGIKLCKEWKDFQKFYEWSFANGYNEKLKSTECSIDRVDINGNYEPQNCRWVSKSIQSINCHKYKSNKSGYRCVYKDKSNKFKVCIKRNKKSYYLGTFQDILSAVKARNNWAKQHNMESIIDESYNDIKITI